MDECRNSEWKGFSLFGLRVRMELSCECAECVRKTRAARIEQEMRIGKYDWWGRSPLRATQQQLRVFWIIRPTKKRKETQEKREEADDEDQTDEDDDEEVADDESTKKSVSTWKCSLKFDEKKALQMKAHPFYLQLSSIWTPFCCSLWRTKNSLTWEKMF